jgi:hypothetical protein
MKAKTTTLEAFFTRAHKKKNDDEDQGDGRGGLSDNENAVDAVEDRTPAGKVGKRARESLAEDSGGSRFEQCPICLKDVHRNLLFTHTSTCNGTSSGRKKSIDVAPSAIATKISGTKGSGNAFASMMEAQRERERSRVFSLSYDNANDRWVAVIGKNSSFATQATWSAAVTINEKLANGKTCATTMKLVTDFNQSADAGPIKERAMRLALKDSRVVSDMRHQNPSTMKPSVIKSALQKNIRRGRAVAASRVAMHMCLEQQSFVECVRRLVIICLEDGILHPDVTLLTWLMCAASKGYEPPESLRACVSRIAGEMAAIGVKDCVSYGGARSKASPNDMLMLSEVESKLADGEESTIVQSIIIRAHFGGMAGDVAMLKGFSHIWLERFTQKGVAVNLPSDYESLRNPELILDEDKSSWLDYIELIYEAAKESTSEDSNPAKWGGPMRRVDIPIAAVDFHVSSCVQGILQIPANRLRIIDAAKELGLDDIDVTDRIKSAIWRHSAGVNHKVAVRLCDSATDDDDKSDDETSVVKEKLSVRIWNIVREDLETWVKRFIVFCMPK